MLGEGDESAATNDDFVKQGTPVPTTTAQRKAARDKDNQRKKRAGTAQASDDESVSARKPSKRARMADDD
jgi:chromatin modification-related protein EAF6